MGLDISISTNCDDEIYSPEYYSEENDYFNKHSLSRAFCNFIHKRFMIDRWPNLEQVGKVAGIDVAPIYAMEDYRVDEEWEFHLEKAETEQERQNILFVIEEKKRKLEGNIDLVIETISGLIDKLSRISNLPDLLLQTDFGGKYYFSDFESDKGDGYIGNNFGQDLRNFERFLEFAKAKNATTVWFRYG